MKLTKRFLHNEPKFFEIPKSRLIIGLIIGLFYSLTFYSFLYLSREVLRILSQTETRDLWILTDKEVSFYNLFFAFLAVIISQSIVFVYWLDRPKSFFGKQNHRKSSIVNDQRVLNWYFLYWFSKLAIFYGFFFGISFYGAFYVFSFYPDYKYLFVLIIIVLFAQTWNTIRLAFKGRSIKWLLTSIVIISALSFGLSKINLIDYKSINESILSKNIYNKYNLKVPESGAYERTPRMYYVKKIYIGESKEKNYKSAPVIVIDNQKIELEDLHEKTAIWLSRRSIYDRNKSLFQLYINKSIKMEFINRFKDELAKSGASRIAYSVVPKDAIYDRRYYQDFSYPSHLIRKDWELYFIKENYKEIIGVENTLEIKYSEPDIYSINGVLTKTEQLKDAIKTLIKENPDYLIKFYVDDSMNFNYYFNVLSCSKEAVNEIRNKYAQKKYSKEFDLLSFEEQEEVKDSNPFYLLELTNEILKMVGEK